MSRLVDYDDLIASVLDAAHSRTTAELRQQLIRRKATTEDLEQLGALTACELACIDYVSDQPSDPLIADAARGQGWNPRFVNGLGCCLSDLGQQLDYAPWLHLAASGFAQAVEHLAEPGEDDAILYANWAKVLERLDDYENAISAHQSALELNPDWHDAHKCIAALHETRGDLKEAAAAYETYLARVPDDANEWISIAIVYCDAERFEDAQRAYWRAAGLEPDNPSLHFNWLITASRIDKPELATDALGQLERHHPKDWRTAMGRAFVERDTGSAAAAFEMMLTLVEQLWEVVAADDNASRNPLDYTTSVEYRRSFAPERT